MNVVAHASFPETRPAPLTYSVGDIHGRADLLAPMLDLIRQDSATRRNPGDSAARVVFLGDYVDRGAQSKQVIDLLLDFRKDAGFECHFLLGNHEDAMLDYLDGRSSGAGWGRHGGGATLQSYGITPPRSESREAWAAQRDAFIAAVPAEHRRFLDELVLMVRFENMIFVHAGLRSGIALDQQMKRDLLWIRSEFLQAEQDTTLLVVHGHTPKEKAYGAPGRLCLDSGAYVTGRLTGAVFDGASISILETAKSGAQVVPYRPAPG